MNNVDLRQSLKLKEKYKTNLNLVRYILDEKMDSLASPSKSQWTFEEIPSQPSSATKPTLRTPRKMVDIKELVV